MITDSMVFGARLLTMAVVVWTGWGRTATPTRDESEVVRRFGSDLATDLMPLIAGLENDFYQSDARHVASDLEETGELAAARFRARHPEVRQDAVSALAWCYTYGYR